MNLDVHMKIELIVFLLFLFGTLGGGVFIWSMKQFIRTGNYKRKPVEKDGDTWYENPSWLRLPLLIAYGFTWASLVSSLFALIVFVFSGHFLDNLLPSFTTDRLISILLLILASTKSKWLSILSGLLLFLFESYPRKYDRRQKRRTTIAGLIFGAALAIMFYSWLLMVFELIQL